MAIGGGMKRLGGFLCGLFLLVTWANVLATESGDASQRRAADAACTKCHDESEAKPILSIYQTPHGVLGDDRAPSCKSCHGESQQHLSGTKGGDGKRLPPDVVFGTTHTTAGYAPNPSHGQSEPCLTCHKSGLRT